MGRTRRRRTHDHRHRVLAPSVTFYLRLPGDIPVLFQRSDQLCVTSCHRFGMQAEEQHLASDQAQEDQACGVRQMLVPANMGRLIS
jgi:hypothetical protein